MRLFVPFRALGDTVRLLGPKQTEEPRRNGYLAVV